MEYERRRVESDRERDIIKGMIVSSEYLKKIKPVYKNEFFSLPYAKTLASWIMEYYDRYEKSPVTDIQSIFENNKSQLHDKARIEMIDTFLGSISEEFVEDETYNVDYHVDKTVQYFKSQSLDLLIDQIKSAKLSNDYTRAEAAIANYKRAEKNIVSGIDVWSDKDSHLDALRSKGEEEALIRFAGDLGKLIRPWCRKELVVWMAPGKRSKSWWLIECSLIASFNKLNVCFFSFEMTREQILARIQQRITGCFFSKDGEAEREYEMPFFDANYDINRVVHKRKEIKKAVNAKGVLKKVRDVERFTRSKRFKLFDAPSNSTKATDISLILDNYEHYEGFVPDVILIDYPDILKYESNKETRHAINDTWLTLRAISQERNCLVVVVSHTNKATLDRDVKASDFAENSAKVNHITQALSINQSEEDIDNGIQRISVLADRFENFNPKWEAVVTQCLDIGAVHLDSRLVKKN